MSEKSKFRQAQDEVDRCSSEIRKAEDVLKEAQEMWVDAHGKLGKIVDEADLSGRNKR